MLGIFVLFFCFNASAQTPSGSPKPGTRKNIEVLPLSQVHKGMTGYGLTVFSGTEPQRFSFKVVGIKKTTKDANLIAIELSGGPNNILEKTKVMAGMSGSPLYVRDKGVDKIIGSVASTVPFETEPYGYATPIENLLNFQPSILESLNKGLLQSKDVALFQNSAIKAGSAYTYYLIWGDVNFGATATVTYLNEDRNIFFSQGHPGFGFGKMALPFSQAEVIKSMPNLMVSFKDNVPSGPMLGTMIFDGPYGQLGQFGVMPKSVPVNVRLEGITSNVIENKFSMAYFSKLGPILGQVTGLLLQNKVDKTQSLELEASIQIEGLESIVISDNFDDGMELVVGVLMKALADPTADVTINGINLTVKVKPQINSFKLLKAKFVSVDPMGNAKVALEIQNDMNGTVLEREVNFHVDPKYYGKAIEISDAHALQGQVLSFGTLDKTVPFLNRLTDRRSLYLFVTDDANDAKLEFKLPGFTFSEWRVKDITSIITVIGTINVGEQVVGKQTVVVAPKSALIGLDSRESNPDEEDDDASSGSWLRLFLIIGGFAASFAAYIMFLSVIGFLVYVMVKKSKAPK